MMHQDVRNLEPNLHHAAVLKLMGVGGGGCNAIEHMVAADIHGLSFTCVNTDAQALARYQPHDVIQLGNALTRGLGAGADPQIGRLAAEEDKDRIAEAIGNADLLFLTAGMGGGTGTGAVPVVAKIARELGVLTVAVVTKPFAFEGEKRRAVATAGIEELRRHVDSLIVVPNENLLKHLGPNIPLIDAFAASNDILTNAVQSIAELITTTGLINVDFADVKSVMTEMGQAMMSTGRGIGEHRARDAAIAAIESPLLDNIDLREARGILANVTASADLSMGEFQVVGDIIANITAADANVVIGTVFDPRMKDEMRVTVVATGLGSLEQKVPVPEQRNKRKSKKNFFRPGVGSVNTKSASAKSIRSEAARDTTARRQITAATTPEILRPGLQAKKELCYLCENLLTAHSEQCPLREEPLAPVKSSNSKLTRGVRPAGSERPPGGKRNAPVQKQKLTRTQKLNLAGVAAGVLILATIFYSIVGNTVMDGYSQLVSNSPDSPALTSRKERDAGSTLSSIEE